MRRMHVTCGTCAGCGFTTKWKDIGDSTLHREDTKCEICDGRGYTEYAMFSIEEAEAILKHCGLNKE